MLRNKKTKKIESRCCDCAHAVPVSKDRFPNHFSLSGNYLSMECPFSSFLVLKTQPACSEHFKPRN